MKLSSDFITPEPDIAEFLSGGGEMGQRIRNYNWSATPIGNISNWPQSLRTTLSILLISKFPMFLWWGKELVQFYNDAYRPSLGNDGKHPTALGQNGEDCWPEIWHIIKPLIDQVMAGNDATWSEDQLIPIYRNGKIEDVYWTFSYSPVKIENGTVGGVLVVCNETTEKVVNLKKLEESESKLRFAIEAAELGTWDYNPIKGSFTANSRLKNWFGFEEAHADIPIAHAINIIAEKDRTRVMDAINSTLQYTSGGHYDIEYTIIHPLTKNERIVKAKGKVRFNDEKIAYRFNGTLHDITDQTISQKKMEEAETRVRNTAESLQLALDAGRLGSYEFIVKTGEIYCTKQCKENFGLAETDFLNIEKLFTLIVPDDRASVKEAIHKAIAAHEIYNASYRVLLPDGALRWIKASGKPVYNELNEALKITGITLDITEQKIFAEELSKQVKERTMELHRSNEDLLQFAHVASHDLKEPVRKVKTFSNRLQDEFGELLPEKGRVYLDKVKHATDRMFSMIEGVLRYASLNPEQTVEKIDLNDVITNIETDLEVLIHQKNGVLKKAILPVIDGTPVLIYQLFYNLINNSLKFSKPDQQAVITISSAVSKKDGQYLADITIEDNGIGFEQHYAEQIFNAFARLNAKDKYEGTGLGLVLCKRITAIHHGTITANGVKNEGATFKISLPLTQLQH